MKRIVAVLLALVLCLQLAGCISRPEEQLPTGGQTEEPASRETTGSKTPADGIVTPDQMPEKPQGDYAIPPGEDPGDRAETGTQ